MPPPCVFAAAWPARRAHATVAGGDARDCCPAPRRPPHWTPAAVYPERSRRAGATSQSLLVGCGLDRRLRSRFGFLALAFARPPLLLRRLVRPQHALAPGLVGVLKAVPPFG